MYNYIYRANINNLDLTIKTDFGAGQFYNTEGR